jgi:hypothetical protein
VVWVRRPDQQKTISDWVIRALGEPDGIYYTLGREGSDAGTVVFDVDPRQPVRNRSGNDITVHATGGYVLSAANNWEGPWYSLGPAQGPWSFDLAAAGLDSARYLKIVNSDSAKLDAISYLAGASALIPSPMTPEPIWLRAGPNPVRARLAIDFGLPAGSRVDLDVIDVTGRRVRTLARGRAAAGAQKLVWDLSDDEDRAVAGGVYFCRLSADSNAKLLKIIVQR